MCDGVPVVKVNVWVEEAGCGRRALFLRQFRLTTVSMGCPMLLLDVFQAVCVDVCIASSNNKQATRVLLQRGRTAKRPSVVSVSEGYNKPVSSIMAH